MTLSCLQPEHFLGSKGPHSIPVSEAVHDLGERDLLPFGGEGAANVHGMSPVPHAPGDLKELESALLDNSSNVSAEVAFFASALRRRKDELRAGPFSGLQ